MNDAGGMDDERIHNEFNGNAEELIQAGVLYNIKLLLRPATPTPRSLPRAITPFVSRHAETARLTGWLTTGEHDSPRVVMVTGLPGIGKTALAARWGNEVETHYPGGTLYADLADYRSDGGTSKSDVIAGFLVQFGHLGKIPPDLPARVGLYRSYVKAQRVLVVIDNLEHAADIELFAPTSPGSALLATCTRLADFITAQRFLRLDPLDDESARRLLSELVGDERLRLEPDAAAELLRLCGGHPRALSMAVMPLRQCSNMTVARCVRLLQAARDTGSDSVIDAIVDPIYETLSPDAAALCRLLAWHPGPEVSIEAICGVENRPPGAADAWILELQDANLLEEPAPNRFRMLPLVRNQLRARSRLEDGDPAGRVAFTRWLDWYLEQAQAADQQRMGARLRVTRFAPAAEPVFSTENGVDKAAARWLNDERAVLLALQRMSAELDMPEAVVEFGEALWALFINVPYLDDWLESSRLAVEAAEALPIPDIGITARMRCLLGRALMDRNDHAGAAEQLDRAIQEARDSGRRDLLASSLEFRGRLLSRLGRHREALPLYQQALDVFTELDDSRGMALQLHFIGQCHLHRRDYEQATKYFHRALRHLPGDEHARDIAKIRIDLGKAMHDSERLDDAYAELVRAVAVLAQREDYRYWVDGLRVLASVAADMGQPDHARHCLTQVRDWYAAMHNDEMARVADEQLRSLPNPSRGEADEA